MHARLPARVVADIESALDEPGSLPREYLMRIAEINPTTLQTVYRIKKRLERGWGPLPLSGGPVPVLEEEEEKALDVPKCWDVGHV